MHFLKPNSSDKFPPALCPTSKLSLTDDGDDDSNGGDGGYDGDGENDHGVDCCNGEGVDG